MTDVMLPTVDKPTSTALSSLPVEVSDMFYTIAGFEAGQRMAVALAKSTLLPETYQNNPANCMVLLDIAHRFRHMGISPFTIAQQLVPVKGKFGWQGQFVIGIINACGRYSGQIEFEWSGTDGADDYGCTAVVTRKDGTKLKGTKITWRMVKEEGWNQDKPTKTGGTQKSKWNTMRDQMFMYRSATFFGRTYLPDMLMGFHTADELEDMGIKDVTPKTAEDAGADLTNLIMGSKVEPKPAQPLDTKKPESSLTTDWMDDVETGRQERKRE